MFVLFPAPKIQEKGFFGEMDGEKKYLAAYLLIFALALDFWRWGNVGSLFWGLPIWVWHMLSLTFILSAYYFFFAKNVWRVAD